MNAWVVTWNGTGELPSKGIVAAYNYRTTDRDVRRLVEQLYLTLTKATPSEILRYAKDPKTNPYPAVASNSGPIACGGNPWLEARYVKDIRLIDGEWVWNEPDFKAIRKRLSERGL